MPQALPFKLIFLSFKQGSKTLHCWFAHDLAGPFLLPTFNNAQLLHTHTGQAGVEHWGVNAKDMRVWQDPKNKLPTSRLCSHRDMETWLLCANTPSLETQFKLSLVPLRYPQTTQERSRFNNTVTLKSTRAKPLVQRWCTVDISQYCTSLEMSLKTGCTLSWYWGCTFTKRHILEYQFLVFKVLCWVNRNEKAWNNHWELKIGRCKDHKHFPCCPSHPSHLRMVTATAVVYYRF